MITEPIADLTAEFIASAWLGNGLSPGQMLFRPLGAFRRRSHLDVEAISEQEIGHFSGRVIESNRSGIYDYLPEQLFHLPSSASINTLKKKVNEIRLQREKEQKSRLFFLPIEQEFFLNRVSLTQLEQRAFELDHESGLLQELTQFWQLPEGIAKEVLIELLPILPLVSEFRGNMEMTAHVMSKVLNVPVKVETEPGKKYPLEPQATLADARLGVDTIFGGELDTYQPELCIKIELPDAQMLESCLQDLHFDRLVHWLAGWFIPAECDYFIHLQLDPNAAVFHLEDETLPAARLGYAVL